jgi:toxin ParE1/3/4
VARVHVTPRAEEDLQEIWLYIAPENVEAADRMSDRIGSRIERLAEHPQMGTARPDIAPDMRILPVGNYLALYRILDTSVEVVRVVDGRRNLPELLDDEG